MNKSRPIVALNTSLLGFLSTFSTVALIGLVALSSNDSFAQEKQLNEKNPTAVNLGSESSFERGSYLVNAVLACDGCHTPRGPVGFDMTKRFSGGMQTWDEPSFTVKGSNITPDRETGIGTWTENDLKRALTQGIRPDGTKLAPQMPFAFYKIMTPADLDAVVTYIRSVQAVRNQVQAPVYKAMMHVDLIPDAEKPIDEAALQDTVKRGFYLGTIAHCMECHARRPDGTYDFKSWLGKGGHIMNGPFGTVTVANITSHPQSGIGAWSDSEIRRALTQSVSRDGRPFMLPMARHIYYSKMTESDIDAIISWLRTIPPLE